MFIPDEILTLIFLKLSLEDVKAASQTCKQWRKIISADYFKAEFYLSSKPSSLLLVKGRYPEGYKTTTIEFDPEEKLGLESFELKPYSIMEEKSYTARSVCNGLILANNDDGDLFVMNMATKHHLTLPKCPSHCRHNCCWITMLFCADKKAYKIIHMNSLQSFEILIIGTGRNKWRVVPYRCPDDDFGPINVLLVSARPGLLTTDRQRTLHWRVFCGTSVLSMDVPSETFRYTLLPSYYSFFFDHILEIGDSLGVVHLATETRFEVSVLRDPLAGNWEPLYSIETEGIMASQSDSKQLPSFVNLRPIFSLREGNVIILKDIRTHWWYFYDAKLRKMKEVFSLETTPDVTLLLYHGSLFHWNNAKRDNFVYKRKQMS